MIKCKATFEVRFEAEDGKSALKLWEDMQHLVEVIAAPVGSITEAKLEKDESQ